MSRIPAGPNSMHALIRGASQLPRTFAGGGVEFTEREAIDLLWPYISDARQARIESVIESRTENVAVVVDGLANTGNVAAVMRTAEGLGYLNFHILSRQIPYKHSARITQGTEKWLDIHVWDEALEGVRALKSQGYQVVATHLDERSRPIGDFDFSQKTALVFGNELGGVSPDLLAEADATCIIPMSGFAQSFNISVAAATALYHAREDRMRRLGRHGDLDDDAKHWLRAAYAFQAVGHAQSILDHAGEAR